MKTTTHLFFLFFCIFAVPQLCIAQPQNGEQLFIEHCAACHLSPPDEKTPNRDTIKAMTARAVLSSMTDGPMRIQSQLLSTEQKITLAEYLTDSKLAAEQQQIEGQCDKPLFVNLSSTAPRWNGWGLDINNRRFQSRESVINAENVGKLKLKWAFGFADATQARSQPTIIDNKLFITSQTGKVYAIDALSGCTYWSFQARAGARNGIAVAEAMIAGQVRRPLVMFADAQANVYALDAETGELYWSTKIDDHPAATATGSPTYYNGVLYVVLSGVSEESAASRPDYECCTFRGSLTAIDVNSGYINWKTYTVDEPKPRGKNNSGTPLYGPAGVPIWSAPTIDPKRQLIYAATGNAYADPPSPNSDAIIAFSLGTGKIQWVRQMRNDVWIMGCDAQSSGGNADAGDNPNCPEQVGPDFDFSASPILTTTKDGRDLLVITQKSGMAYALDPDKQGEVVWQYQWGEGSGAGAVWGAAVDDERAYFARADVFSPPPGGLHAVDFATGEKVWSLPPHEPLCEAAPNCMAAQSAAVTTIPGVVFSGSMDGGMRAYDSSTGKVLWTYDTNREFDTVNGVVANGGSIDGPGQVVVNGMLYVTSGNGGFFGRAGNVLLAFGLE